MTNATLPVDSLPSTTRLTAPPRREHLGVRRGLLALAAFVALVSLAACGGGSVPPGEGVPAQTGGSAADEPPAERRTYPMFGEKDYIFILEHSSVWSRLGPMEITVEDGHVVSATVLTAQGQEAGSEAPPALWVTIDDIIGDVNNPEFDSVTVHWPDGQGWPSSVSVDAMLEAVDDEFHYAISEVRVAGRTTTGPTSSSPEPAHPLFDATDYTFVLKRVCYGCPDLGPVEVTVEDGEVTSALILTDLEQAAGSEAPRYFWTTINRLIHLIDDPDFDDVIVKWPAGQDWPDSVFFDFDSDMYDDEIGYIISDVRAGI